MTATSPQKAKIKDLVQIPQPALGHEWMTPRWWAAIHEIETIYGTEVAPSHHLADTLIEEADNLRAEMSQYTQLHMALTRRRLRISWVPQTWEQVEGDWETREAWEAEERYRYQDVAGMVAGGDARERLDDGLREVMGRLEVEAAAYRQAGNALRHLCEQQAA